MKKIWVLTVLVLFLSLGTASGSILFSDEIINGTYSFDNNAREMVMNFNTIYAPYDSETGVYYPSGTRGVGTEITWVLTLDFSSWVAPGGELPGAWEESWVNGDRMGDFAYFSYEKTGTDSFGQNTGDYFGKILEATSGRELAPEGPWYIFGNLTRTWWDCEELGYYMSGGTIGGTVTNQPVPEPATMLLLGSGLVGLAGIGRRTFKKQQHAS